MIPRQEQNVRNPSDSFVAFPSQVQQRDKNLSGELIKMDYRKFQDTRSLSDGSYNNHKEDGRASEEHLTAFLSPVN